MISLEQLSLVIDRLRRHPEPLGGIPLDDHIAWQESVGVPGSAEDFARETIWVICNSGMKHTIARQIYDRCTEALQAGLPVSSSARDLIDPSLPKVFGHPGKSQAIDGIWRDRTRLFTEYLAAPDKVAFCGSLPWIGGVTKYHLAKNFGADVAKPDVHLQRLADHWGSTPQSVCERLGNAAGYRAATIDLILWMACAKGVIDSVSGQIVPEKVPNSDVGLEFA